MNLKKQLREITCIGNWIKFHYKDDRKHEYRGICVDEVAEISNDYAHRLQKIVWCQERFHKEQKWQEIKRDKMWVTIRACYYVIKSNKKGIVFGQFCMNSYQNIVGALFKKANKKGFFKPIAPNQMKKEIERAVMVRNAGEKSRKE